MIGGFIMREDVVEHGRRSIERGVAALGGAVAEANFAAASGESTGVPPEQLAIGRGRSPVPLRSIRGNILALPFRAGSFELVFSARISHHIGSESDREAWLRELMRVSSRAVVATVFDRESLKNRLRELRRRLGSGKRSKFTMSLSRVRELAAGAGFELVAAPAIAPLLSGHRYLVLSRTR